MQNITAKLQLQHRRSEVESATCNRIALGCSGARSWTWAKGRCLLSAVGTAMPSELDWLFPNWQIYIEAYETPIFSKHPLDTLSGFGSVSTFRGEYKAASW